MNHSTLPRFSPGENRTTQLHTSQWIHRPLEEIFEFFSRPENLQRLTPTNLQFDILTPSPIVMKPGLIIDYKLKVHGIPLHWTSLISTYKPPHHFVDEQIRGPYKTWIHHHRFTEENGGTRVEDQVAFRVPGGKLVEKLIVQKDLASIFQYRHQVLEEIFGEQKNPAAPESGSLQPSAIHAQ